MKRPFEATHKLVKRLADLPGMSFGKIAQVCGKEIQTAEAWGREPESNANPFGTGKRNPLDCVLRLIALAHKESPALAREIAEMFSDYADFLDRKECERATMPVNELIGHSAKEHTDVVVKLLNSCEPDWHAVHTEIVEAEIAMKHLKNHVKAQLGGAK